MALPNRANLCASCGAPIEWPANQPVKWASPGGSLSTVPQVNQRSSIPDGQIWAHHSSNIRNRTLRMSLPNGIHLFLQNLARDSNGSLAKLEPHCHVQDRLPTPTTAPRGEGDIQPIELDARAGEGDRLAIKSGLAQCPFNVHAVGFRALHRGFTKCSCSTHPEPSSKVFGAHEGMANAQSSPVLGARERGLDALGNHLALLFGKRRIDVQRESVTVAT